MFEAIVATNRCRALHDLLSGVSSRLLKELARDAMARPAYMQPALRRDHLAATGFYEAGPWLLRQRRLRHGLPAGPVSPDDYQALVVAEVRESIGAFRRPPTG